jgi:hypothetical protein
VQSGEGQHRRRVEGTADEGYRRLNVGLVKIEAADHLGAMQSQRCLMARLGWYDTEQQ